MVPARGAALGDLFNDGHIDVAVNNIDSTPTLLQNVVQNDNHWITFRLIGGPKSPRDAIGAKVFLTAGGLRQRQDVFSGGSYGSSSDQRVHFGLGSLTKIDKVEIDWPSGTKQDIAGPSIDQIVTVVEGRGTASDRATCGDGLAINRDYTQNPRPRSMSVIAFHEKAGRSQVSSFLVLRDKVFLSGRVSH